MKKIYLLLLPIFSANIYAQEVVWQKDIHSSTQDFLSQLSTTIDRQYIISGSSIMPPKTPTAGSEGKPSGNNGYDFHIVKLNQQGEQTFEKFFSGSQHDFLTSTSATQEGGFILAGTTFSSEGLDKKDKSHGGSDIWVIKITDQGNEEWQKTLGRQTDEEAKSVIQSVDLGYFVAGSVQNVDGGFGSKDVWIIKLDKSGKELGEVYLGGKGLDEVEQIIPTQDGGVLLAIYSRSGEIANAVSRTEQREPSSKFLNVKEAGLNLNQNKNTDNQSQDKKELIPVTFQPKTLKNQGEGDFWIVKLDKIGKVEWQKNFGGKEDDHIRTIANTDTGYIIAGESRSSSSGDKLSENKEGTDLWIISLNRDGDEIWQKSYTFGNRDVLMSLNSIWTRDGHTKGYLVGGYTQAEGKAKKNDETFWLLYLSDKGDEVWRKHVEGKGKKNEERLVDAKLNTDGTYILAGTSAEELGKENWKVVKLGDRQVQDLMEKQPFAVYPNPVSEYCYVEIGDDFTEATISIYDMTGRLVQTLKTKNSVNKINTSSLPQGTYIINAVTENNKYNAKIVKK